MRTAILAFLMLSTLLNQAQDNCGYVINEKAVIENRNLDAFLSEFKKQEFTKFNNRKNIPAFIKRFLDCKTGDFSIANPNEKYQSGCIAQKGLPKRRIIFLAKSKNIFVLTYAVGGVGSSTSFLFIKFDSDRIIDYWSGVGMGIAEHKSLEEISKYITQFRKTELGLKPTAKPW